MAETVVVPNQGMDPSAFYAAMNNNGANNWLNNPFAYLMFLPFMYGMTGNGWGNGGANGAASGVALGGQIQNLSNQISDNQNTGLTMQAIQGVAGSVKDNGIAVGVGFDQVASGICGLKTVAMEQGYQNQLANCQQTNTILQSAQGLSNTVQNGFTQLGFQLERNACDVKETSSANTQRIIDTLGNHWQAEAQSTITQLRDEIATLNQTNALIAALGGSAATAKSVTA